MSTGLVDQALNHIADHTWKTYGTPVSLSNNYTIPSDGIVRASIGYQTGSYCQIAVDNVEVAYLSASNGTVGATNVTAPVFKGQKVTYLGRGGTSSASFYPFVNVGGGVRHNCISRYLQIKEVAA